MCKVFVALVPLLVVAPHLIHLPDRVVASNAVPAKKVEDDGKQLPEGERMVKLAKENPVAFLEACVKRHAREVKSYTLTFHKQERLDDSLGKKEVIEVSFREEPHSVFMRWKEGSRLVARALYVEGENKDEDTGNSMVVIRPAGIAGRFKKSVLKDPNGADAKKSGRYPISEFGLRKGLERTINSWKMAQEDKALHVEYLGKEKVEQLGGRECWVLKRTRFAKPENDGVTEQTAYIDVETWMMVGSTLKNADGQLIAEYFFKDIRLNVDLDKDLFTKKNVEN
jgi:hypothetical protein